MVSDIKRVAVIGAGVSGLTAARHLLAAGVEVILYERSSTVGGVWSYDERRPLEPKYPSITPSIADFTPISSRETTPPPDAYLPADIEKIELLHAPPGPAYDGLTNNISTVLQELKSHPWPANTGDFVNVRVVGTYLQDFASSFNILQITKLNTRVEKLGKVGEKWRLESSILERESGQKTREIDEFDAVVVASGHYHGCKVPDIPGLSEWKAAWPERIQHSKRYRHPEEFKNQTVLLIGAGVSSTDIAREISPFAAKIYQSSRSSPWDIPLSFLPATAARVAGITSFSLPSVSSPEAKPVITLTDGSILTDVDCVVICTGYHITYPFLSSLHSDNISPSDADSRVLVTDGTMVHNLHRDIFYIPDPSLAFVGAPYYIATFTLFEFQSIAVAAVFSGRTQLPAVEKQREEYAEKVRIKGLGRGFHSLKGEEEEYVREMVTWVNEGVQESERVEGHSEAWVKEKLLVFEKMKRMFGVPDEEELVFAVDSKEGVKNPWVGDEKREQAIEA